MEQNQEEALAKGWWPDPRKPEDLERYFDGAEWTGSTRDRRTHKPSFAPAADEPAAPTLAPKLADMAPGADGTVPLFAPAKQQKPKKDSAPKPPRKNEAPPPPKESAPLFAGDWAAPREQAPEPPKKGPMDPKKQRETQAPKAPSAPAAPSAPPKFSAPPQAAFSEPPAAPKGAPPAPPAPTEPPMPKGFNKGDDSDPSTAPIPICPPPDAPQGDPLASAPPPPKAPPAPHAPKKTPEPAPPPAKPMPPPPEPTAVDKILGMLQIDEERKTWLIVGMVAVFAIATGLFLSPPQPANPAGGGGEAPPAAVAGDASACEPFAHMLVPGPVTPELYDALLAAINQPEPPEGLADVAAAAVSTNSTDPLIQYCGAP